MTPSIIIAVLIATGIWAAIASIIAHNRGREYDLMADRHNSVVDALRKTEVELEAFRVRKTEAAQRHTEARNAHDKAHLAALERIEQLTADRDRLTQTCDDLFDTLVNAVAKMPVPFHLRKRDEYGRFAKISPFDLAMDLHYDTAKRKDADVVRKVLDDVNAVRKNLNSLCDEVKANAAEEAFDDMMGNAIEQLKGLTVKPKSSSQGCAGNDFFL
jgi:hypothetical protein